MKCCSIFDALTDKWWIYYWLKDFKLIGMAYYNHSSLVILIKDAKYIHFYPTFHLPPVLLHCNYKTSIKSIEFYLVCFKFLVKLFVRYIIIDLSYNLNEHRQDKHVWRLFEVGCLHQHTVSALYRLYRNEKLLEFFAWSSNNRAFYRPELKL